MNYESIIVVCGAVKHIAETVFCSILIIQALKTLRRYMITKIIKKSMGDIINHLFVVRKFGFEESGPLKDKK